VRQAAGQHGGTAVNPGSAANVAGKFGCRCLHTSRPMRRNDQQRRAPGHRVRVLQKEQVLRARRDPVVVEEPEIGLALVVGKKLAEERAARPAVGVEAQPHPQPKARLLRHARRTDAPAARNVAGQRRNCRMPVLGIPRGCVGPLRRLRVERPEMRDAGLGRILVPFAPGRRLDEVREPAPPARLGEKVREQSRPADDERDRVEAARHDSPGRCAPGGARPPGISPPRLTRARPMYHAGPAPGSPSANRISEPLRSCIGPRADDKGPRSTMPLPPLPRVVD
jgi:hypothetical protein